MRMMIVGSDKVYAIENFYVKYLREAGVTTELFRAQSLFVEYYHQNIVNKLVYRAGLSGIIRHINKLFRQAVQDFKPDTIWVFKGMEIFPSSLEWAKRAGIVLVNYNPDNPFLFTGKGSGNKNITQSIPIYDLHFTYNQDVQNKLKEVYQARTAYLPFGFELSERLYSECASQKENVKACFLGNPDHQRAAFILSLAEQGITMDIYGNDWQKFVNHSNLNIHPPVLGDEVWKVLRRYRIQLNLMRVHNEDSHNMRSFEVPGVGGIMLAPDTTEHRQFFEDGKEVFLFRNLAEAVEKTRWLISRDQEEALTIRLNARTKSLRAGYSYKDRANAALQTIKLLRA